MNIEGKLHTPSKFENTKKNMKFITDKTIKSTPSKREETIRDVERMLFNSNLIPEKQANKCFRDIINTLTQFARSLYFISSQPLVSNKNFSVLLLLRHQQWEKLICFEMYRI